MNKKINIGCGKTPIDGWTNLDNSLAIKLANTPLLYKVAKYLGLLNSAQIDNVEWNKLNDIQFADATKSLPFDDESVEIIYTSHMLEHLSRSEAEYFLKESIRVLEFGGIIRISVPDLKIAMDKYIESEDADAFMHDILVTPPPITTFRQKIGLYISGYRHHQWMYDGNSLMKLMRKMGYKDVEVCKNGYTKISNTDGLNLYERFEQSVYVEGVK